MPEGPEVLTIVDQLDFYLVEKVLVKAEFLNGKYEDNRPEGFDKFISSLPLKIGRVFCKGKLIVFELENREGDKWCIFNSLRMTGTWGFHANESHGRFKMSFEPREQNGIFDIDEIYYIDVRGFGTFDFIHEKDEIDRRIDNLANGFIGLQEYLIDYKTFYNNIKNGKKSSLTTKLTDQKSICSGIGNYLLSEIMYDSRLHPSVKCNELTDANIETLFEKCSRLITLSYQLGGLSIRDYVDISGTKGKFGEMIKVYGKKGKTDPHGNKIVNTKRGNGQTIWYVPGLQRRGDID